MTMVSIKLQTSSYEIHRPSEGANNDKKQVNTAKSAIEALYYNRYLNETMK